jgi:crotonobetainyl-CoA:carnitine CoA-transferase CaiB-like acyl-CoA transferase
MSGNHVPVANPAPLLGEHNLEILREMLGYSDQTVADLQAEGVL